jgi:purine-binding chemotaxis protein CheW
VKHLRPSAALAPTLEGRAVTDPETVSLCAFRVGSNHLVLDVRRVREILRPARLTSLLNGAPGVSGLMQVRGQVIQVMDARARLGHVVSSVTPQERVMVVLDKRRLWGLYVDAVSDVIRVPRDALRPAAEFFSGPLAEVLSGLCEHRGRLYFMLNLTRFLHGDDGVTLPDLTGTLGPAP